MKTDWLSKLRLLHVLCKQKDHIRQLQAGMRLGDQLVQLLSLKGGRVTYPRPLSGGAGPGTGLPNPSPVLSAVSPISTDCSECMGSS